MAVWTPSTGTHRVEETEDGLRIQSHGCPLSDRVRYDPEACNLAEALVEAITGLEARELRSGRPAPVSVRRDLEGIPERRA